MGRFFADLPEALADASSSSSSSAAGDDSRKKARIPLCALELDRVLFGAFPSYARAPLLPSTDRILHAGDAAGGASPLSFGGFGAMLRHLPRLASGVPEALEASALSAAAAPLRGFVSAERRRRRRREGAAEVGSASAPLAARASAAETTAGSSSSSSGAELLFVRAFAARAFAALGRLVDALEYGSGHDGSGSGSDGSGSGSGGGSGSDGSGSGSGGGSGSDGSGSGSGGGSHHGVRIVSA